MSVSRVAVVGGNGKTGRAVSAALEARDVAVTRVGRNEFGDLLRVLADVEALYLIAPNMHGDEPAFVREVLDAARSVGLKRVGYHSVAAPYAPSMPHHLGKAVSEDLVRRGPVDWTILQPCAYVQNFVPALRADDPVLRVAYSARVPFGLVDLHDVAEVAANVLLADGHLGATYELGGPGLVSVDDVARIAGETLGRTVPIDAITTDEWRTTDGAGLDPRVREWLAAMFEYYDGFGLPAGPVSLRALLGREPTALAVTIARELV